MPEATHTDQPLVVHTSLLSGGTQPLLVSHTSRANSNLSSAQRIKVAVLECPTRRSVVVSRCDLTVSCLREQLWRRCSAQKRGFCALTGTEIAAGDDDYRLPLVDPVPLNLDAMILASVMETIPLVSHQLSRSQACGTTRRAAMDFVLSFL
jgi:hypothetical protein